MTENNPKPCVVGVVRLQVRGWSGECVWGGDGESRHVHQDELGIYKQGASQFANGFHLTPDAEHVESSVLIPTSQVDSEAERPRDGQHPNDSGT